MGRIERKRDLRAFGISLASKQKKKNQAANPNKAISLQKTWRSDTYFQGGVSTNHAMSRH